MPKLPANPAYSEFVEFIVERIPREELLAFKLSPTAQARVDELVERQKAGDLSADEEAELEQIAQFELFVRALKTRAITVVGRV